MNAKTFLFVYGTLMRGSKSELGRLQRRRLARESIYVGPACLEGRIYDLGSYPGLKINLEKSPEAVLDYAHVSRQSLKVGENKVRGDVVRVLKERVLFQWLDGYEGVRLEVNGDGSLNRDTYSREIFEVQLDTGQRMMASMYVCSGPIERFRQIYDGCWLSYSRL